MSIIISKGQFKKEVVKQKPLRLVYRQLVITPIMAAISSCYLLATPNTAVAQQFVGRLTGSGVRQACNEVSGGQAGKLIRVDLNVDYDNIACDFSNLSVAAKISRACQIQYGGNPVYRKPVAYRYNNGGAIPYRLPSGCYSS
jgi:hypothetical protein